MKKKLACTAAAALFLACFAGCVGGNTNIEPTELADQMVEEFKIEGLAAVGEEAARERYGLITGVPGEGVEAFDIREGDEGKETRLVAIVKAKGKEEAQKAEEQLRAAAGKLGLTNVRFERSGSYVFAADGGFAEQMAEEFLRLTH